MPKRYEDLTLLELCALPAVYQTLADIAAGNMLVSCDGQNGWLEEWKGRKVRDNGRKLLVSGVVALTKAGLLSEHCTPTESGLRFLAETTPKAFDPAHI